MMFENIQRVHAKLVTSVALTGDNHKTFSEFLVEMTDVGKSYNLGPGKPFFALHDVSLRLSCGSLIALMGSSGSGKSTLLNLLAGLDRPTRGRITIGQQHLEKLSEDGLARYRGKNVGVVFQMFQLLPTLTSLENVMLAMELVGSIPRAERRDRAMALLGQFGVDSQANKLPTTLSGGQQQRVAIARALANDPPLLVADEPTGNLDSGTAEQVIELLSELPRRGKTVIMATHEARFEGHFDRVISLHDGQVKSDVSKHELDPTKERQSC